MTSLSDHLHEAGEGTVELRDELNRLLKQIRSKNCFYHAIKDFSIAEAQAIHPGLPAGATVVVKDNIHAEGYQTSAGMASALPNYRLAVPA